MAFMKTLNQCLLTPFCYVAAVWKLWNCIDFRILGIAANDHCKLTFDTSTHLHLYALLGCCNFTVYSVKFSTWHCGAQTDWNWMHWLYLSVHIVAQCYVKQFKYPKRSIIFCGHIMFLCFFLCYIAVVLSIIKEKFCL